MYISRRSKRHQKEAENARKNRMELIAAGLTRRDLVKMGLMTASGLWVMKHGLSPWAPSKAVAGSHCGFPPPLKLCNPFTEEMPRLRVMQPVSSPLDPAPAEGPVPGEGRPPADQCQIPCDMAGDPTAYHHQRFDEFWTNWTNNKYEYEIEQKPITGWQFHSEIPLSDPNILWGFGPVGEPATVPGPVFYARYGEPIILRNWNKLPVDPTQNGGFGINQVTTHLHNGHNASESDGNPMNSFLPNKFWDYHWPNILAGYDAFGAIEPGAGLPTSPIDLKAEWQMYHSHILGDYKETMSTLWYHDHKADFTAQNVYKGLIGMYNLYGPQDSGWENDPRDLAFKLPSSPDGTRFSENGVDYGYKYDVNIMLTDKVFDENGQMAFDHCERMGVLGTYTAVNFKIQPYFKVERRKYRFRIVNAGPSRFHELFLSNNYPFVVISNDGNLLERPLTKLSFRLGVAERMDVIIDFSKMNNGEKFYLENRLKQTNGQTPVGSGFGSFGLTEGWEPPVQRLLQFWVDGDPEVADNSCIPDKMIPMPDRTHLPNETPLQFGPNRTWAFTSGPGSDWSINGKLFDHHKFTANPKLGTAEIWKFKNGPGGWDHPIHVHMEEGQTLSRSTRAVPTEELLGKKDVWRLDTGDTEVEVFIQFREWKGQFPMHCHNVVHEDHAMMTRYKVTENPETSCTQEEIDQYLDGHGCIAHDPNEQCEQQQGG